MKKVLFINPNWKEVVSKKGKRYNQIWPPLDLLNCAALLEKNGIQAEVVDLVVDLNVKPELIGETCFQASNYQWVFLTSSPLARWQCPHINIDSFYETTQLLPKNNLCILGVHGTLHPEGIIKKTGAGLVIQGEPEMTVLDICQGRDLDKIEGIVFIQDGRLISNPPRKLFPLTQLPPPAFSKVDVRDYYYEVLGKDVVLIEATRGCSFNCFYCLKIMHGGRVFRYKSADQVKEEIQVAIEQVGAKAICFIDLEFPVQNREFVSSICQLFLERNYQVPWSCITRPDLVEGSLLHLMRKSGCRLIHFGVETGSKSMMKLIQKILLWTKSAKGLN